MKENKIKKKLLAGEVSIGTLVFEFNTPGIARILEEAGSDFIIYDMEHTGFGVEDIRRLMSYNRGLDVLPIVRVPDTKYAYMARSLDIGAKGLMIPLVETREQLESIINASKYYPLGTRGTAFNVAHDDFKPGEPSDKMASANDETLIIAQIETIGAVENIEEIVSTDGIDVAWVGHFDLSQSMGIPGQVDHPRMIEAMEKVAEACEKYGKVAARMVPDVDSAMTWIKKGYRCLAYSGDIWVLQNAMRDGITSIKDQLSVIKQQS